MGLDRELASELRVDRATPVRRAGLRRALRWKGRFRVPTFFLGGQQLAIHDTRPTIHHLPRRPGGQTTRGYAKAADPEQEQDTNRGIRLSRRHPGRP